MTIKKKILNDPVYGFISIPGGIIFELIEHPFFQRLRRINQLGLSSLVYPGAIHTRFQHSIGAMHLTTTAIDVLKSKGAEITQEEAEAVKIAVLLHDIGHTPFSHSLEKVIIAGVAHEQLSLKIMEALNSEFDNRLSLAIKIFTNNYEKKFLHQLVAGQLDMDRLDYLRRDSFFTGVSEGVIGSERIIKMLIVVNDDLAVEAKGIYSIEKFLIARRLMYWQVYLHKTALAAELVLQNIFKRAKELWNKGEQDFHNSNLEYFFSEKYDNTNELLKFFINFDDHDVYYILKQWTKSNDKILSDLSKSIIYRKLPGIRLSKEKFPPNIIEDLIKKICDSNNISKADVGYYLMHGSVANNAYSNINDKINILYRDSVSDISDASDMLNLSLLSKLIKKYYVCAPKEMLS